MTNLADKRASAAICRKALPVPPPPISLAALSRSNTRAISGSGRFSEPPYRRYFQNRRPYGRPNRRRSVIGRNLRHSAPTPAGFLRTERIAIAAHCRTRRESPAGPSSKRHRASTALCDRARHWRGCDRAWPAEDRQPQHHRDYGGAQTISSPKTPPNNANKIAVNNR